MLAGCIISGRIAGEQATECARKRLRGRAPADKLPYEPKESMAGNPGLLKDYAGLIVEIRKSAWDNLLVIRSKSSVNRFHERIEEIGEEAQRTAGKPAAVPVEVENLLILGKALAKTTLERQESRGGFYREDYPVSAPGTPEVHLHRLSEAGQVVLRKEVFDPQWDPDLENGLHAERWG